MKHVSLALVAVLMLCGCGAQSAGTPTAKSPATGAVAPPPETGSQLDEELDKGALKGSCLATAEENVDLVSKQLDYIDALLPNVTPEESAFLERESKATQALYEQESTSKLSHGPSNARMAALTSRRLYYVWKARKDLADAITSVDCIYNPQKEAQLWMEGKTTVSPPGGIFRRANPDTLYRMLRASDHLDKVVGSLSEFAIREQYRRDQVLTSDQYGGFYWRVMSLSMDLRNAMHCQLAHVVLDSPDKPTRLP